MSDDKRFLKMSEVCERLGVSRYTVYEWVKKGELPKPYKPGGTGHPRWLSAQIEDYVRRAGKECAKSDA